MQAVPPKTKPSNNSIDIESKNERVPLLQKDFMADVENSKPAAATTPSGNQPAAAKPSNTNVFNNITIINVNNTGDPGKNGTYMSFLVVVIGIVVSIITYRYSPDNINLSNWTDFCPNEDDNNDFYRSCKANSAVLRISLAMTIMFALQIIGTKIHTTFYDILWIVKFFVFAALVIVFFFLVNGNAFDTGGYTWFARITGFFFLILQQVILLDLAYTWNESWIGYADSDGERGNYWLTILVIISLVLFLGGYAVLGLLYWQFLECDNNIVIISLTVGLTTLATIIQLFFSENGSILTSAFMTAYASYVCYSAVILNPSASCNPSLNSSYQTISSIIGIILLVISLLWTTYNTVKKIPSVASTTGQSGKSIDMLDVATGGAETSSPKERAVSTASEPFTDETLKTLLMQISVVFLLVSGYYAMVLTNWGTVQSGNAIDQKRTGEVSMWIQAVGEWIAIGLYIWSLVAPRLFPDREF